MITEAEKRQVLLAEWLQKKAEDDHEIRMSKLATLRTMSLRREIYADECNRSAVND